MKILHSYFPRSTFSFAWEVGYTYEDHICIARIHTLLFNFIIYYCTSCSIYLLLRQAVVVSTGVHEKERPRRAKMKSTLYYNTHAEHTTQDQTNVYEVEVSARVKFWSSYGKRYMRIRNSDNATMYKEPDVSIGTAVLDVYNNLDEKARLPLGMVMSNSAYRCIQQKQHPPAFTIKFEARFLVSKLW